MTVLLLHQSNAAHLALEIWPLVNKQQILLGVLLHHKVPFPCPSAENPDIFCY